MTRVVGVALHARYRERASAEGASRVRPHGHALCGDAFGGYVFGRGLGAGGRDGACLA